MAQKGIREFDAKRLMRENLKCCNNRAVLVTSSSEIDNFVDNNPWLKEEKLVVKPDQLFGKRGKNNLVLLDGDLDAAKKFIAEKTKEEISINGSTGKLTHFLIEPFVKHDSEYYVAITTDRDSDTIMFSEQGGVDVEENWDKVKKLNVKVGEEVDIETIKKDLVAKVDADKTETIAAFIKELYNFFADLQFSYFEINPFAFDASNKIVCLDVVAKLDDTAFFECSDKWSNLEFPPSFGSKLSKEEEYIKDLDSKTGASLKLTLLNPQGRVWTMVAGGGASVIYADTISDLGFSKEIANYGEYSGNPDEENTHLYAKTILDLMTREKDSRGKVLLIGGGIANFTDVAKTFKGIITALEEYADKLKENNVKIYVRRGGPNYKEGLKQIKTAADELGLDMEVYGPETHMTKIVSIALL